MDPPELASEPTRSSASNSAPELRVLGWVMLGCTAEPNIFLQICTQTQTITISNDLCPPMPTHVIQIAPMYSKIV
jgi:hypothetical protein